MPLYQIATRETTRLATASPSTSVPLPTSTGSFHLSLPAEFSRLDYFSLNIHNTTLLSLLAQQGAHRLSELVDSATRRLGRSAPHSTHMPLRTFVVRKDIQKGMKEYLTWMEPASPPFSPPVRSIRWVIPAELADSFLALDPGNQKFLNLEGGGISPVVVEEVGQAAVAETQALQEQDKDAAVATAERIVGRPSRKASEEKASEEWAAEKLLPCKRWGYAREARWNSCNYRLCLRHGGHWVKKQYARLFSGVQKVTGGKCLPAERFRWWTVTAPGEFGWEWNATVGARLGRMLGSVRRSYPALEAYCAVLEVQERGALHASILFRIAEGVTDDDLPEAEWLVSLLYRHDFGPVNNWSPVYDLQGLIGYMGKAIGETAECVELIGKRVVTCSQTWSLHWRKRRPVSGEPFSSA